MDRLPDQMLRDFTAYYDRTEQFLANATPATNLAPIEDSLHATYHARFGGPGMEETQPYGREEALAGLRNSVESGNKVRVENRTIRMRSSTEAVVFVERVIEKDGAPVNRSFHVESFRLIDGAWKLMRETMELVAP